MSLNSILILLVRDTVCAANLSCSATKSKYSFEYIYNIQKPFIYLYSGSPIGSKE